MEPEKCERYCAKGVKRSRAKSTSQRSRRLTGPAYLPPISTAYFSEKYQSLRNHGKISVEARSMRLTQLLLTTAEVAVLLQIAEITLRKWRLAGTGPRFVRCGTSVRYHSADLDRWIASRTVASTSEVRS
jgi:excisionase family DNA binding protein